MGNMIVCFTKTLIGIDVSMFHQNSYVDRCLYDLPKPTMGKIFCYVLPKLSLATMFVCFTKTLIVTDVCMFDQNPQWER